MARRTTAPRDDDAALCTIDELTARTGIASRTIRFYQTQGVLPPPERRGRVALYGPEHAERLHLITTLQARGLRLSAIHDLVHSGAPGSLSLRRWLGVGERLATPWSEDAPATVSGAELRAMVSGRRSVSRPALEASGLVRTGRRRGEYEVPSPSLLRLVLDLDAVGVELDTAVQAGEIIRRALAGAVDELVEHFAEHVGRGFGRGMSPDDLDRALDALRPLGVESVRLIFAQEMERALQELLARPASPARLPAERRRRRGAGRR